MHTRPRPIDVVGIAGSLRAGSFNRRLLRAAGELAPPEVAIHPFDLGQLPLFNQDVEARRDPEPVAALKAAITHADALLVVTPEHNFGLPGVLKNALDWASRPPSGSCLTHKPVAVMGATPSPGATAQARQQLARTLSFPPASMIAGAELGLSRAHEKFDERGQLVDEPARAEVGALLDGLPAGIEHARRSGQPTP